MMYKFRRIDTTITAALAAAVIGVFLFSADAALAEGRDWNRVDDTMTGALGVHAGPMGGTGLAYKHPLRWFLYVQVAGGIWHANDDDRHDLGCELQYLLRQDSKLRIFTAAGVGYYYHREEGAGTDNTVYSGFGVGVEYLYSERVSLQGELDFTHDSDDGDFILLPQAGLFFYF